MRVRVHVGDRLVLPPRTIDGSPRTAIVIEVLGADGMPPLLLEWEDGSQTIVYPSGTAYVERSGPTGES